MSQPTATFTPEQEEQLAQAAALTEHQVRLALEIVRHVTGTAHVGYDTNIVAAVVQALAVNYATVRGVSPA